MKPHDLSEYIEKMNNTLIQSLDNMSEMLNNKNIPDEFRKEFVSNKNLIIRGMREQNTDLLNSAMARFKTLKKSVDKFNQNADTNNK